ncbi:TonB-dependent receptor plug domain-containing protein [Chitinophaga arvensicola]|uniref:Outer membrane receptor for ferrienterochelin and colicins n=1 Tax=Chitinophaga arvensicola TaxID=29529 RepID=A0A1I0QH80_9BACT|nr:TonB-dependent receptor [Chitinophaga arvensicola]SEW26342.1 outer membrane receptor for ferrienterochelin and colicins [Chitinophaga arvensicola]
MFYRPLIFICIGCCACLLAKAQTDSSKAPHNLRSVEVTATKAAAESLVSKAAMPVTIIDRKAIDMMGSRRLDEVLREQTGLAVVNDIKGGSRAVGLQMQGFSSAYTMILIDGQPMIGRNAGDFDLSRITVSDIERIEIVKGASSSLFGSEALAGVINIVTRQSIQKAQALAAFRYGSMNNADATLEGETPINKGKGAAYLSANYYHTDGFSVNPYLTRGATAPPYNSFSLQGRARYALSPASTLSFSGRYAHRRSVSVNSFGKDDLHTSRDVLDEGDMNASLLLNTHFKGGTRMKTQYYLTRYSSDQQTTLTEAGVLNAQNVFTQYLHRAEVQVAKELLHAWSLTAGAGGTLETMNNVNYRDVGNMTGAFGYTQLDWKPRDNFSALAGVRYDHHNNFGGRLNPSIGLRYTPVARITLKASLGTGFKTPDFKERYQIFTNPQQGYTVLGATVLASALKDMQKAGQISEIRPVADLIAQQLKAETSVSYNVGVTVSLPAAIRLDVNGFYHDVHNLINTIQVATKTNYQQVFSYMNLDRAYMTGLEASIGWKPLEGLDVSAGYQLLYAKDRSVTAAIKAGTWPYNTIRNNNTGESRPSVVSDYFGLENRSRHMMNLRVFYEYAPWGITASCRMNYRGKYGFDDANGNRFIDRYDTFVEGYYLLFASLEKKLFNRHLSVQITADNVLGYTDMLMPAQPGRIIMAGISWRFFK